MYNHTTEAGNSRSIFKEADARNKLNQIPVTGSNGRFDKCSADSTSQHQINSSDDGLFRLGFSILETKQKTVRARYTWRYQGDAITRLDYCIIGGDGFAIDEYYFDAFNGNVQFCHQFGASYFLIERKIRRVSPLAFPEDIRETHEGM
jgi:glycogen debranching enzyme